MIDESAETPIWQIGGIMELVNSLSQNRDWRVVRLLKYPFHCKKAIAVMKGGQKNCRSKIQPTISKELQSLCRFLLTLCLQDQDTELEEPE